MDCTQLIIDIGIGLITGIVAGIISGLIVYKKTKKKEHIEQVYSFWNNYLFNVLASCEIYIPSEELRMINEVGKEGSSWYEAIHNILHYRNPFGHEDKELTREQEEIFNNFLVAIKELEKWKSQNL